MTEAGGEVQEYPRVGFGLRHPEVAAFLATTRAVASEVTTWPNGRVRASAFATLHPLPDVVASSVRCIVRVGDGIVVCRNAHDVRHAWPGGGRERGESFAQAACREVLEETGWLLDAGSLRQIGWLHIENLTPVPATHRYPHPDAFHAVFTGRATERAADTWTDTEGYELSSEVVPASDVAGRIAGDPLSAVFVRLVLEEHSLEPSVGPTPT